MNKTWIVGFILCQFTIISGQAALAQSSNRGSRLDGTIGAGAGQYNVSSPTADITMGSGAFFTLQGEKPFGASALYHVGGFNYSKTTGTANYNYVSVSGLTYTASTVNYAMDEFHAQLGLRFKLFDNYNVRPYVEAGGVGGYMQLTYDNSLKTPAVLATGGDYKTIDGALDFGIYAEAGLEVSFTQTFGARVAYQFDDRTSQSFETLRKQMVHYTSGVYYGGLIIHF